MEGYPSDLFIYVSVDFSTNVIDFGNRQDRDPFFIENRATE